MVFPPKLKINRPKDARTPIGRVTQTVVKRNHPQSEENRRNTNQHQNNSSSKTLLKNPNSHRSCL